MMKFAKRALIAAALIGTAAPALAVTTPAQTTKLYSTELDYLQASLAYFGALNSAVDPSGKNAALNGAFKTFIEAQSAYFDYVNSLITVA